MIEIPTSKVRQIISDYYDPRKGFLRYLKEQDDVILLRKFLEKFENRPVTYVLNTPELYELISIVINNKTEKQSASRSTFDMLAHEIGDEAVYCLIKLKEKNLLNENNFHCLIQNFSNDQYSEYGNNQEKQKFQYLYRYLNQESFNVMYNDTIRKRYVKSFILARAKECKDVSPDLIHSIIKRFSQVDKMPNSDRWYDIQENIFVELTNSNSKKIINSKIVQSLMDHPNPYELALILYIEYDSTLALLRDNMIKENVDKQLVDSNLDILFGGGLLIKNHRDLIINHPHPLHMAIALFKLNKSSIANSDIKRSEIIEKLKSSEQPLLLFDYIEMEGILDSNGIDDPNMRKLILDHKNSKLLLKIYLMLKEYDISGDKIFVSIARKDISKNELKDIYLGLKDIRRLPSTSIYNYSIPNIIEDLVNHHEPKYFVMAIQELFNHDKVYIRNGYLDLKNSKGPYRLCNAFLILSEAGLLFSPYYDDLIKYDNRMSQDFARALVSLNKYNILNEEVYNELLDVYKKGDINKDPLCSTPEIIKALHKANLLTRDNIRNSYSVTADRLYSAISFINNIHRGDVDTDIQLTQEIVDICMRTRKIEHWGIERGVYVLTHHNILNQNNFIKILQTSRFWNHLDRNVNKLYTAWSRIPGHLFNQDVFLQLINIANQNRHDIDQMETVLNIYVNNLLHIAPEPQVRQAQINYAQSTHNQFVEKSVSESAIRLFELYGSKLSKDLDNIINEIRQWAETLGQTHQEKAARRGLLKVTDPTYSYINPHSKISTYQLIALAWLAIHDDSKRNKDCSLAEAKSALITAAFEFQREYHLDDDGNDLNTDSHDLSACTGGTFNKIMEKLVSIHPAVNIEFITKTSASKKLPHAVTEVTTKYLAKLNKQEYEDAINRIKSESTFEPIWDIIKEKVRKKMIDYTAAYSDDEFNDLIESGIYTPADEEFYTKISEVRIKKFASTNLFSNNNTSGYESMSESTSDKKDVNSNSFSETPSSRTNSRNRF